MYYGNWACWNDVAGDFNIDPKLEKSIVVLYAEYNAPDYEGYATVVFVENGKFYFVGGSHCSCFGLEGQWEPDETPLKVLLHMATEGQFGTGLEGALRTVQDLGLDQIPPEEATLVLKLVFG